MSYSDGGDCPRSLSALPCQLANGVEGVVDVADLGPGDAAPAVAVGQQFQFFKVGRRFQALPGAGPQGAVGQGQLPTLEHSSVRSGRGVVQVGRVATITYFGR